MLLNAALTFAEANVPIFAVRVWREANGWRKQPHITRWSERATTSPRMIEAWWACWPDALVGVPLARVGLVVIDADRHGGPDGVAALREISLPPHPIVTTRSGGEHHFFRQPAQPIHFKQWSGGEVLGEGRFVVGYSLEPFISRPPVLTPELMAKLQIKGRGNSAGQGQMPTHMRPVIPDFLSPTQSVILRSKYLLRELARAERGNRNNMLHWVSCRFGNMIAEGKLKPQIAAELLISASKANWLWSEDGSATCLATIRSGLEAGKIEWEAQARNKRAHGDGASAITVRQRVRA